MSASSSSSSSSSPPKKRRKISACAYYGPPPKELTDIETLRFVFRDFKNIKRKNGEICVTKQLIAHNYRWKLEMYPQGQKEEDDGYICLLLCVDAPNDNPVDTRFNFRFPSVSHKLQSRKELNSEYRGHGFGRAARYIHVVKNGLDSEGNLIVDVDIQVYVEKKPVWYPKKVSAEKFLSFGRKLLSSDLESDITFVVGDSREKIRAHRIILAHQAPTLYGFINELKHGEEFVFPDIDPSTFKILMEYIYTDDIPDDLIKKNGDGNEKEEDESSPQVRHELAKNVLLAANRFGLIYLKLYIESEICAKLLSVDNAAEWLTVADAQVCPLLKEGCMKLFLKERSKFKSSSGWKHIQESSHLLEELLDFTDGCTTSAADVVGRNNNAAAGTGNTATGDGHRDYDNMSVRMLREELESKDMDLDGTKSMLIQRLKEHHQQQQNLSSDA